jgi:Tol biopolymer transport system component
MHGAKFGSCVLVAVLACPTTGPATASDLRLVSALEDPLILGAQASQAGMGCDISADGRYVVFQSAAENLVAGDTNGVTDIFVKDRSSGDIERINRYADGRENPAGGYIASISDDARYVSFQTVDRLLDGAGISAMGIYLYDRQAGTFTLVSKNAAGEAGNSISSAAHLSGGGRHVVFYSYASDLVASDGNATSDIFLYAADTDTVTRVSVDAAGAEANGTSGYTARVSDSGRRVAFDSDASNLVAADNNGERDVFVKNIATGGVRRVSIDSGGVEAQLDSHLESLSGDGSMVAFTTGAALVADDNNGEVDLFAHRLSSAQTVRVNVGAGGTEADTGTIDGALSVDGNLAVFSSASSALAGPVPNGYAQVFLKDIGSGAISFLSYGSNGDAALPALDAGAAHACYQSRAGDIIVPDRNDAEDIFVVDVASQIPQRISESDAVHPVTVQARSSRLPDLGDDGAWVTFSSRAFLVDADSPPFDYSLGAEQIYRYEVASGAVERLSRHPGGELGDGASEEPAFGGDGRHVAFASYSNNLVGGDSNDSLDVFHIDTQTGAVSLITPDGDDHSYTASVSDTGTRIAFESEATNLIGGDNNGAADVYLWDAESGLQRLSLADDGSEGNDYSGGARLSGDGRHVVFMSYASNLVGSDGNGRHDIFLHDIDGGQTRRISVAEDGSEGDADAADSDISRNGRYVVFDSAADNLVPDDDDSGADIFLYDSELQSLTRISSGLDALDLVEPERPRVSAGGDHVVFVAHDGDGAAQLMRYARTDGSLLRLLDGPVSDAPQEYAISEDGSRVVFSAQDRLSPLDTNNDTDIYLLSGIPLADRIFDDGFELRP